MRQLSLTVINCLLLISVCFGQTKKFELDRAEIKKNIVGYLRWHKIHERDTSKRSYSITKGGYPDTTTRMRIDMGGLEQYLNEFRGSHFVSESFTNNIRDFYVEIDQMLEKAPKVNGLVKFGTLDMDPVLRTYETDAILDHINECHITKLLIIYNKALVGLHVSTFVNMVFILTKTNNKWLIDYLGHDNSGKYSLFTQ